MNKTLFFILNLWIKVQKVNCLLRRTNHVITLPYTPMSDAVKDAYIVSTYMKQKFPFVLSQALGDMERPEVEIPHPRGWGVEFSLEVDLALDVIARAFQNQGLGYSD